MDVRTARQCRRCSSILDTSGARGLCLACLNATTTHRFSASDAQAAVDDFKLEEGLSVGPQDRFLLHDRLGAGGMGEVWLATDQELSREDEPYWVALKFLGENIRGNKNAINAVRNEVIRSQELNHQNIVRVFDIHTTMKGTPFIKMEYVKGNSLVYWLEDCPNRVMHWKEVVDIAQQLCSALQYAHETAGVIHRDIKPGNLLLRTDRILKVADFGIAEALYTTRAASLKQKGLGTIWYASPQQLLGQRASPADDIHAVGATLYELLAGEPPFLGDTADHTQGDSADALIHQVRYDPAEPIRQRLARRGIQNEIPPKLVTLVHRCLEKNALARPMAREILTLLPSPSSTGGTQVLAPVSAPVVAAPRPERPTKVPEISPERWEAVQHAAPDKPNRWITATVYAVVTILCAWIGLMAVKARVNEGTLQVDLSQFSNPASSINIEAEAGTFSTNISIAAGERTFSRALRPGSYKVTAIDGAEERWEAPAKIERDRTNLLVLVSSKPVVQVPKPRIETKGDESIADGVKRGTLRIRFENLLVSRPKERTLIVSQADGTEMKRITVPSVMVTHQDVELRPGRYKLMLIEDLDLGVWTVSGEASVTAEKYTQVVLSSELVYVQAECNVRGARIIWDPAVNRARPSFVQAGESAQLPMGTFPITAVAEGYIPNPPGQMATVQRNGKISVQMMYNPKPREGLDWTNSLGMPMVGMSRLGRGVWACRFETRIADVQSFLKSNGGYQVPPGMFVVTTNGVVFSKEYSFVTLPPGFPKFDDQLPAVGVSWNDADAFCKWLTEKEHVGNRIEANQRYTMPTAEQWAALAGGQEFPWGNIDSDYKRSRGNYSGKEARTAAGWPGAWPVLTSYDDTFPRTAPPTGAFANALGLVHVGGNAGEWTLEKYVCGGSWADGEDLDLPFLATRRHRDNIAADERHDRFGFRVLLVTDLSQKL